MAAMTRVLFGPRQAAQATTPRVDTQCMTVRDDAEGRPAFLLNHDERTALRRDHAFVQAAAFAALRGGRV
jgi:hypothetical protein